MTLFFETAIQANGFLRMLPLGFLMSLCLDAGARRGIYRMLTDILLLLTAGAVMMALFIFQQEDKIRLYHLLGLFVGAFLYMQGAGKLRRMLCECRLKAGVKGSVGE